MLGTSLSLIYPWVRGTLSPNMKIIGSSGVRGLYFKLLQCAHTQLNILHKASLVIHKLYVLINRYRSACLCIPTSRCAIRTQFYLTFLFLSEGVGVPYTNQVTTPLSMRIVTGTNPHGGAYFQPSVKTFIGKKDTAHNPEKGGFEIPRSAGFSQISG